LVCISLEIEISICLIILEFLDIVQSQPLPDIPAENPALFSSEKTGLYTESLLLSRRQNHRSSAIANYLLITVHQTDSPLENNYFVLLN